MFMPEKPFQEKVYNNWFLVILVHLHQFTTYVLFRSCLMGGGETVENWPK